MTLTKTFAIALLVSGCLLGFVQSKQDTQVAKAKTRADVVNYKLMFRKAVNASPTTLQTAIESAEAATKGRAYSAEMKMDEDKFYMEIGCLVENKVFFAIVDAKDGLVTRINEIGNDDEGDWSGTPSTGTGTPSSTKTGSGNNR